ncbi:MAG TPA: fructose-6-phosphate aldolase [candidate division WOR-3 bacterium]|uniref:Fructose-6-phosphate aldolase n=1 Tax=candidate division WOR-3 bacterium TaxID=2052148 RepID=A0A7V0XFE6_UNCW3|nr:fructose-6-phosphate aldolase [candidate division WOR-3 bacterium]
MKLFIDSADIGEIREAAGWGILEGCTTNPSLVRKTGRSFRDCVTDILAVVDGPVSVEAVSPDAEGMVREGEDWAKLDPEKVTVKIPMGLEGLKAIRALAERNIKTNCTLVFSPTQAMLACRAGASFISPFVGRLDDIGHDGMELVADAVEFIDGYGLETEVIAASLRHPLHVIEAARAGAHISTIPFKVLKMMAVHPLTEAGIRKFNEDFAQIPAAGRQ